MARLTVETVIVFVIAAGLGLGVGLAVGVALVAGFVVAQVFVVVRVAIALLANPIDSRYLLGLESTSHRLRPLPNTDAGRVGSLHRRFGDVGLDHLVSLGMPSDDDPTQQEIRHEVYASASRLVIVAAADDERGLTVISRVADGRLVVTTSEVVPPHVGVLLNRCLDGGLSSLLVSHVTMLDQLRRHGLRAISTGFDAVTDQLRCEWEAWDRLGPFLGPFLAVDPRPQPHLLMVRLPDPLPNRLLEESSPLDVQRFVRYRFRRSWADQGIRAPGQAEPATTAMTAESGVEVFVDVPQSNPTAGVGPSTPVGAAP